jgi:hypothetical protein
MSRRVEEFSGINTNSYLFDQYKEELLDSGRPIRPTSFIQTTEGIDHYMYRMHNAIMSAMNMNLSTKDGVENTMK